MECTLCAAALALLLAPLPCEAGITVLDATFNEQMLAQQLGGQNPPQDFKDFSLLDNPITPLSAGVPGASGELAINRGLTIEDFTTTFLGNVSTTQSVEGDVQGADFIAGHFALVNIIPPPVPVTEVPIDVVFGLLSSSSGNVRVSDPSVGFVGSTNAHVELQVHTVAADFSEVTSSAESSFICALQGNNLFACSGDFPSVFKTLLSFPVGVNDFSDTFSMTSFFSVHSNAFSNGNVGQIQLELVSTADPVFQIDPSFPYVADYQLIFSSNLFGGSGPTPAPEPSSALLVALGLAAIAGARRYKRSWCTVGYFGRQGILAALVADGVKLKW